jgi:transposase IS116/IS110/IS902 family protein
MAKLLMTVPGIGYYSALLIVSEIGDINRFPDSYHLCSYAGLIPSTHSSGGITYHGSITKTGYHYETFSADFSKLLLLQSHHPKSLYVLWFDWD